MSKRTVTQEELAQPLVPYEDALKRILGAFEPLPPLAVPLREARGLVIAEAIVADQDVPGFDNSAMDGYAVRAADVASASREAPAVLPLAGDFPAGAEPGPTLQPGTAVKVMTGGPIPPGADTVVPWEDTEARDGAVAVQIPAQQGRHVRPRGEDVAAGDTVVETGTVLRPVHVGVIASLGRTHVRAHPSPRVAILSTGDEVVAPGGALRLGQVFDSNATLLAAMCEGAGARILDAGHVPDDPVRVEAWIAERSPDADLIVTSGGASVGEHDWLRDVLAREGELQLWRVAIKPGKPIAFGRIGGAPVLALPGNPGSAFVGAHAFVCPAIRIMAALPPEPVSARARLAAAVKGSPSRTSFVRVQLEGDRAVPMPAQSSVVLSNLIGADGFAIVPPGGLPQGTEVRVEMIDAWRA